MTDLQYVTDYRQQMADLFPVPLALLTMFWDNHLVQKGTLVGPITHSGLRI